MKSLYEIDKSVLFFFNKTIHSDLLNMIFVFFSDRKSILFLIPLLLVIGYILHKKGNKQPFKKFVTAIILTIIVVSLSDIVTSRIIKPLFGRSRPCQVLEGLYFWKQKTHSWVLTDGISSFKSSYSFVSSHASNSMAAAIVLSIFYRKYISIFLMIAFMIGTSRLYLGVHYPSDVISGWLFGTFSGFLCYKLYKYISIKYNLQRF